MELLEDRVVPSLDLGAQLHLGPGVYQGERAAVDDAGNMYVLGKFQGTVDFDPGPGSATRTAASNNNVFLAKYSSTGTLAWAHSYGGATFTFTGLGVDRDGNVYTSGKFSDYVDFDPGAPVHSVISSSPTDGFVLKLNAQGEFAWVRNFSNGLDSAIANIGVVPAGGVVAVGTYSTTGFIIKLDTAGVLQWQGQFGGATAKDVALTRDGSIYVSGQYSGEVDLDPGPETALFANRGTGFSLDMFVAKLDSAGRFEWARTAGSSDVDSATRVHTDGAGNAYVAGFFSGTVDFDPGPAVRALTGASNTPFAAKYDAAGNLAWAAPAIIGAASIVDEAGNFYVTGAFGGTVDFDPGPGVVNLTSNSTPGYNFKDVFLYRLGPDGKLVWAHTLGTAVEDLSYGLANRQENVLIAGDLLHTFTFNPNVGTATLVIQDRVILAEVVQPVSVVAVTVPGGASTNSASVVFAVSFSHDVTGVDQSDFQVYSDGSLNGAAVTSVSERTPRLYEVVVGTGASTGALRLDLIDDDSIVGPGGRLLGGAGVGSGNYRQGAAVFIDREAPVVSSSLRVGDLVTAAAQRDFLVTFAEDVTDVNAADFQVRTSGTITGAAVNDVVAVDGRTYRVTIQTGVGHGTLQLDLAAAPSVFDLAGNALTPAVVGGEFYSKQALVRTITPVGPAATATTEIQFVVEFAEAVSGVDALDFTVLAPDFPIGPTIAVAGGGAIYQVTVGAIQGDGPLQLVLIDNDTIVAGDGQPLGGLGTVNGDFLQAPAVTIDQTPPSVQYIGRLDANPVGAATVRFLVQFSEDVAGVDLADFQLSTSAEISGARLAAIEAVGAAEFIVTIETGSGTGNLRLDLIDDDTIHDVAGNVLGGAGTGNGDYVSGESYYRGAAVLGIGLANANPTNVRFVVFTVQFSEDVTGVDVSDFTPLSGYGAQVREVRQVSGSLYEVVVDVGFGYGWYYSWYSSYYDYLGLAILDDDSIHDLLGKPLGGSADASYNSSERYYLYSSSLAVESITRAGDDLVLSGLVDFLVTFNQPLLGYDIDSRQDPDGFLAASGVDPTDFTISATGSLAGYTVDSITRRDDRTFLVRVHTGSGAGTLHLDLQNDWSIMDYSHQSLGGYYSYPNGTYFSGGESYTVLSPSGPRHLPASINVVSPSNAGFIDFTITFNTDTTGVDLGDFRLEVGEVAGQTLTGAALVGLTPLSARQYVIRAVTGSGTGRLSLSLVDDDSIRDSANLPLNGVGARVWPIIGTDIVIDRQPPQVLSVARAAGASATTSTSPVRFVVHLEDVLPLSGVDAADFQIVTTGTLGSVRISEVADLGNGFYEVSVQIGAGDGTVRLDLVDDDTIRDQAGNPLGGPGTGTRTLGETYSVDRTAPQVVSVVRQDISPTAADHVLYQVTFSEAVAGVDLADFVVSATGSITGGVILVTPRAAGVFDVKVSLGYGSGIVRLDVVDNNSIVDSVGNKLGGALIADGAFFGGQSYQVRRSGSTLQTAVPIAFLPAGTAFVPARLLTDDPVHFYALSLQAGDTVRVHLTAQALGSSLEGTVRVYDQAGQEIAVSLARPGQDAELTFQAPRAGSFYVRVSGADGTTGSYHLELTKTTATLKSDLLGRQVDLSNAVAVWGETLDLTATIANQGGAGSGTFVVEVRLSADAAITDSDTLLDTIVVDSLGAGASIERVVHVRLPVSGFPNAERVYLGLHIDAAGQVEESAEDNNVNRGVGRDQALLVIQRSSLEVEPNNARTEATPVPLSTRTSGTLTAGDVDWYRLQLTQSGKLTAHVEGVRLDTRLSLLDETGRLLVQSDGMAANEPDDSIAQHLNGASAGKVYYLKVESRAGVGDYVLTTTFVPAALSFEAAPGTFGLVQSPYEAVPDSSSPKAVAIGDFNHDGRQDVAITSEYVKAIVVQLGEGQGRFAAPLRIDLDVNPGALLSADLNGDGHLDLATASQNKIYVLYGVGDGSFAPPQVFLMPGSVFGINVGDFTGDGRLDLVTSSENSRQVFILIGQATGGLGATLSLNTGFVGVTLDSADFNRDGYLDLVVANDGGSDLEIYLGGPNGQFQPAQSLSNPVTLPPGLIIYHGAGGGGSSPPFNARIPSRAVAIADFTGDGLLDLATSHGNGSPSNASVDGSLLFIFPGRADGTFAPRQTVDIGLRASTLIARDFTGDGRLDLIASADRVVLLLGNGAGGFTVGPELAKTGLIRGLPAAADVNGDGWFDLLTGRPNQIDVLLGGAGSTFRAGESIRLGTNSNPTATGDFNGDGRLDLVSVGGPMGSNVPPSSVSIRLGLPGGTFAEPQVSTGPHNALALEVADFNGDGRDDAVITYPEGVAVLLGVGDGSLTAPRIFPVANRATTVVVGDFNGDGKEDIATGNRRQSYFVPQDPRNVSILLGKGDGSFEPVRTVNLGVGPTSLLAGDFNRDGRTDLATAFYADQGNVQILYATETPDLFASPQVRRVGRTPETMLAGDFNGDQRLDIVVENRSSGDFSVLIGLPDGTFAEQQRIVNFGSAIRSVGDFNNDGKLDLVFANVVMPTGGTTTYFGGPVSPIVPGSASVSVLLGLGDGTFANPRRSDVGFNAAMLTPGDFNQDGLLDLATTNAAGVSVLFGIGDGTFLSQEAVADPGSATPLLVDLVGDGTANDAVILTSEGRVLFRAGLAAEPGRFAPPVTVNPAPAGQPGGSALRALTVLDTDSGPLLVGLDRQGSGVSLFRRQKDGTFLRQAGPQIPGAMPTALAVGDLDGDGLNDLVVAVSDKQEILVYRQQAPDQFTLTRRLQLGTAPGNVLLADVDGRRGLDIVVAQQLAADVTVFLNDTSDAFATALRYRTGTGLYGMEERAGAAQVRSLQSIAGLAAADIGGDGVVDLLVTHSGMEDVAVLRGTGAGFFNPDNFRLPAGSDGPGALGTGNFNGDPWLDLAILNEDSGDISIWLGTAHGTFVALAQPGGRLLAGADPSGLTVADVNGDRHLDLLIGNQLGDILTLAGNGDGTFQPFRRSGASVPLAVMNVNGRADVVLAVEADDVLAAKVRLPNGASFQQGAFAQDRSNGLQGPGSILLEDLNADGRQDLVIANSGSNDLLVYLGLPEGAFGAAQRFFAGTNPGGMTPVQLNDDNGDGLITAADTLDLAVANRGSNDVSVLFGKLDDNGVWTFNAGPRLDAGIGPLGVTFQDRDNDGIQEMIVTNSDGAITSLPGIGSGGLGTGFFDDANPTTTTLPSAPISPIVSGFIATQTGIFQIDLSDFSFTQVFSSTSITAFSTANFAGATVFLAGFEDGSIGLLTDPDLDGKFVESLTFSDAQLTDPSALRLVDNNGKTEIYATSEGLSRVFVFGLGSDAIPISPRGQQAAITPFSQAGLVLIATLVTSAEGEALGASGADLSFVFGLGNNPDSDTILTVLTSLLTGGDVPLEEIDYSSVPLPPDSLEDFVIGVEEALKKTRLQLRPVHDPSDADLKDALHQAFGQMAETAAGMWEEATRCGNCAVENSRTALGQFMQQFGQSATAPAVDGLHGALQSIWRAMLGTDRFLSQPDMKQLSGLSLPAADSTIGLPAEMKSASLDTTSLDTTQLSMLPEDAWKKALATVMLTGIWQLDLPGAFGQVSKRSGLRGRRTSESE